MSFFRKITAALAVASIAASMAAALASAADDLKITFDSDSAVKVEYNYTGNSSITADKQARLDSQTGWDMSKGEYWICDLHNTDVFYITPDEPTATDLSEYDTVTLDAAAEGDGITVSMYIGDNKITDISVTKGAKWNTFSDNTASFEGVEGIVKFVVNTGGKTGEKVHVRSITFSADSGEPAEEPLKKDTDFTVAHTGKSQATNMLFDGKTDNADRTDCILDFGSFKEVTLTKIRIYRGGKGEFDFYGSNEYDGNYKLCTDDNRIIETRLASEGWNEYEIDNVGEYRYIYIKQKSGTTDDKAAEIELYGTVTETTEYPPNSLVKDKDFTVRGTDTDLTGWFNREVKDKDEDKRSKCILDFGGNKTVILTNIDIYGAGNGAFEFYGSDEYDETYAVCTEDNLIATTNLSSSKWSTYKIKNAGAYRYIYMKLKNAGDSAQAYRDKAKEIVLCGAVSLSTTVDATALDDVFTDDSGDCAIAYHADFKLEDKTYNNATVTWEVKDVGKTKIEKSYGTVSGKDSSKYGLVITDCDEDTVKASKPAVQATFISSEEK